MSEGLCYKNHLVELVNKRADIENGVDQIGIEALLYISDTVKMGDTKIKSSFII